MVADYNANLVAYTYKKNKTPREAQLPVITKFKGMEELMIQVTSKKMTEKVLEEIDTLQQDMTESLAQQEVDLDQVREIELALGAKVARLRVLYKDLMYMLWKLGCEKLVRIDPARINEKFEATTNMALQSGDLMNVVYKELHFDRMNRREITERMHHMIGAGPKPKGKGRGGGQYNVNNNNNNNNQRGRPNACYNEGVTGGQCEAYNKYGRWAPNRPNGCRFYHKFGRKRSSQTAGLPDPQQ